MIRSTYSMVTFQLPREEEQAEAFEKENEGYQKRVTIEDGETKVIYSHHEMVMDGVVLKG